MAELVVAIRVGHHAHTRAVALGHLGDRLGTGLAVEVDELIDTDLRVAVLVKVSEHLV